MDFRQYDAGIGRFYGLDLLAEATPWATPNHFALNNPVIGSDPTGLLATWSEMIQIMNEFATGGGGGGAYDTMTITNTTAAGDGGWSFGISYSDNSMGTQYSLGTLYGSGSAIDGWANLPQVNIPSGTSTEAGGRIIQQHVYKNSPYYNNSSRQSGGDKDIMAGALLLGASTSEIPPLAGLIILGTAVYLYSGDYVDKMNREIEGIKERVLGPPGFAYELVATKNGYYPNLNTGVPTYLKVGEVWKFGETTQNFGRYPDKKINLDRDHLDLIPLPPGGNQMQIKIQEKYLIYGYFFLHGHRPPENPIFR